MSAVKIRFLEARTVQDEHVGTDLETSYEAGSTYSFDDPRSAARWVKRGAAVFASPDDASAAREAVGDFVEADPNARAPSDNADFEQDALARDFGLKVLAAHMRISVEDFARLSAAERVDALNKAHAEFDEMAAAYDQQRRFGQPPAPVLQGGPEGPAGQNAGPGAGADTPDAEPDFDKLTDDELRAYITDRDGRAPHHNTGRAKLLEAAKGNPGDEA